MNRTLAAKIYVLARPVLVSQLAVMAYAVIDTIMAGRHGTDDLAAVGIEASIYFSLFVGLTGVLLAVTPTIAHLYGARRDAEIGEQVRQAMWLAAFLAAISIAAFSHPEPFLRLSKPPPIRSSSTSPRSRSWPFVARLGAVTSAAHQIAANVAAVMYMLPLATGTAVGVLVAHALGAKDFALARSTGLTGLVLALAIAATSASLLIVNAARIAGFYTQDGQVRALATSLLVLVGGYHLFDAIQAVTINTLCGYRRAVVPLIVNAIGMWLVGLVGGVVIGLTDVALLRALGIETPLGVGGFWIVAILGMAVATSGILGYLAMVSAPRRARLA